MLYYLKNYLAYELSEINKKNAKPDIDPKVIDPKEPYAALYFFLSVCYTNMLPIYESENKEHMAKLLKNLEQICKDFSTKDLDSSYLGINSDRCSYYKAFVKKLLGMDIEQKELDDVRENQEKMSNVLCGTNVVSEIAAIKVEKELTKDKTPIMKISNDHLLISDLFFHAGSWYVYFESLFKNIEKKYGYSYKFCDNQNTEYKKQIEDFLLNLIFRGGHTCFPYLKDEMKLFVMYRTPDLKSCKYIVNVSCLNDGFFGALKKITDDKIKNDICLKIVQIYSDYSKSGNIYFLLKTLASNQNFKKLFKTICDLEPICAKDERPEKSDFYLYHFDELFDDTEDENILNYSSFSPCFVVDACDYLNGDSRMFKQEFKALVFWDYFEKDRRVSLYVPKLLINLANYLTLVPKDLSKTDEIKKIIFNDSEVQSLGQELLKNIAKYSGLLTSENKIFNDLDDLITFVIDDMFNYDQEITCFTRLSEKAHEIEKCPEGERKPIKFFYRILKIVEQYIYDLSKSDKCFEYNRKKIEEFIGLNYKFTAYFSPDIVFHLIENKSVQKYLNLLDPEKNKGQIKYIIDEAKKIKDGWTRNKIFNVLWNCNNAFKKGLEGIFEKSCESTKSITEKVCEAQKLAHDNNKIPGTEKNGDYEHKKFD